MRLVIIGAVAAGTSAAAKARRNSEELEIIVFEKDHDISYSVCGLPYYIGDSSIQRDQIAPRNAQWFEKRYHVQMKTSHEVLEIIPKKKQIRVKNLATNEVFLQSYDRLIISTGAVPFIPLINGIEKKGVFTLRNVDSADKIRDYIDKNKPKKAVICGSGFIGLEIIEELSHSGIECSLIEAGSQLLPSLDLDMSFYLNNYMKEKKIPYLLNDSIIEILGKDQIQQILTKNNQILDCDILIIAAGVRPNVCLAEKCGIQLGKSGAIKVNRKMQTNIRNIYAVGDCAETYNLITKEYVYRPLGSTANKMGRIAGDSVTGGNLEFRGILGTGILRFFDLTIAQTGVTEREAIKRNLDIEIIHNIKPNQSEYLSGSSEMVIKAIALKKSGKLIGAQIIGQNGVDKRIDVLATAISFNAKAKDLFHLDLAYAPPFSTTKDPVLYTGMILDNATRRKRKIMTPRQLKEKLSKGEEILIIDVREKKDYEKGHIPRAVHIPLKDLRKKSISMDKNQVIVTHCNKGTTGNAAQNILINLGFKQVYNLSGGYKNYSITTNY